MVSQSKYPLPTIDVTINYTDVLKNMYYSINNPLSIDLNSDGADDGIYYDQQSSYVMVGIYNKNLKKIEQWGTLVDYVKVYPELKNNNTVSKFLTN